MITVGIDLSLTGTGVVILKDGNILDKKLIKSKPSGDKPKDEVIRLKNIVKDIYNTIFLNDKIGLPFPDLVAIEGIAFMARNTGSIMQLAALNYMTREIVNDKNIPFVMVAPTTLKKFITGKGIGPKDVMMLDIYKKYHVSFTDNNLADAFGLAKVAEALLGDDKHTKRQEETINILKKQL